ncbi:hypothetical protein LIA77_11885 [Sarocladium implicatum]|nr:hypothetical protein LIA77_11885 [Sarocladium implicatum]
MEDGSHVMMPRWLRAPNERTLIQSPSNAHARAFHHTVKIQRPISSPSSDPAPGCDTIGDRPCQVPRPATRPRQCPGTPSPYLVRSVTVVVGLALDPNHRDRRYMPRSPQTGPLLSRPQPRFTFSITTSPRAPRQCRKPYHSSTLTVSTAADPQIRHNDLSPEVLQAQAMKPAPSRPSSHDRRTISPLPPQTPPAAWPHRRPGYLLSTLSRLSSPLSFLPAGFRFSSLATSFPL